MLHLLNYNLTLNGSDGQELPVLDNVSLEVKKGTCLGIAGESGSGKSVMCMSMVGLLPKSSIKKQSGQVFFDNTDLLTLSEKEMNSICGKKIGFVFQEPMTAMNPLMKLSEQIGETLYAHIKGITKEEVKERTIKALLRAGFKEPEKFLDSYPHQLSGGMRQRAMIAMALVMEPELIIADEPTTAIDAELQIQLLTELKKLIKEQNLTMIFISHDLGVLRTISDEIAVLYCGNLVEKGPSDEVINSPKHPYTKDLISALPRLVIERKLPVPIAGTLPAPDRKPKGCVYSDRCRFCEEKCRNERPALAVADSEHVVSCWNSIHNSQCIIHNS